MKEHSLKPYETDSSQLNGTTQKVLQPKTLAELQGIIKKSKSLTIRGGGTGLAGGAIPQENDLLDLSKLDKITEFNLNKKIIIVEAGLILDDLQDFLFKYNLEFPINPSSHAICTIGGMISTNAVGSRALKYGRTSEWVLWLEVVNSKGAVEQKNKSEIMDFSGMEGITGVITKACLKLTEKKTRIPEILEFQELEEVISTVKKLKQEPDVTIIEFMDKPVSKMVGLKETYHLFVEKETINKILTNSKEIYQIRDKIYPQLAGAGFNRIEDPKIMLDKIDTLIQWLEDRKIPTYGHISVGILHPCFSKQQEKYIPEMMKLVKRLSGQITGEHGIGLLKKEFIDPNDKKLLINIKKRLDPQNKFNPGKVL